MKTCRHLSPLVIAVIAMSVFIRCGVGPINIRSADQAPSPTTPGIAEKTGSTQSTNKDREQLLLSLFEEHLRPIINKVGCAGCHATTQAPLFAQPDTAKAYHAIQLKVDLENPAASIVVSRMNNKHNCSNNCTANAEKFIAAITAWKSSLDAACTEQENLCADHKTSSSNTSNNTSNNTGNNMGSMNTAKQTQFQQTIGAIFQTNCGSCHAGKYDASSFANIWAKRAAIERRIQGMGNIMPQSGTWAAAEQKQQVLNWLQN